ncbi:VOC family protein [Gordonia soli]|uniref:PhnB-like domain-containing protein n=1 Tax=Gordonia soli NBRC 108243 TaxID=1223545 RepID=M0QMK1_9ACTN|nr:VOC family protein [Gordonia soli]GAC68647.1 hypothetical protein GS4_17_00330 [Gordonia soli NBRC 108243]
MPTPTTPLITPHLWYTEDLFAAIDFYTAIFPDSSVSYRETLGPDIRTAEFTLGGQRIIAVEAARADFGFTDVFSFMVHCADQDEVDRYWDRLLADGGSPQQCGWLIDRFGLRWQVVPDRLFELQHDPDPKRSAAAMGAMMQMVKLDIAELESAADAAK